MWKYKILVSFVIARSISDVAISVKADVVTRRRLPRFARNDRRGICSHKALAL
jgi:hypothetical protein